MPENVPNSTFPAFRSTLNSILTKLYTFQAGTSAPVSPAAFESWIDTASVPGSALWKVRNSGNSSWLIQGDLSQSYMGQQPPIGPPEGLTITTDTTVGNITVSPGRCITKYGQRTVIVNPASITKTAATWVAGSGNGGFVSTIAIGTYHVFVGIENTTRAIDVFISSSVTGSDVPANYSFRRVGSLLYSGGWLRITQQGTRFYFLDISTAYNAQAPTSLTNITLPVPTGLSVGAMIDVLIGTPGSSSFLTLAVQPTTQNLISGFSAGTGVQSTSFRGKVGSYHAGTFIFGNANITDIIPTNTSAQIAICRAGTYSGGSLSITMIFSTGWDDYQLHQGL